jgi:hypothetical protein
MFVQPAYRPFRLRIPLNEQVNCLWYALTVSHLTKNVLMPETNLLEGGGSVCRYRHKVLYITGKIEQVIHTHLARLIDSPVETLSQSSIGHFIARNPNAVL